MSEVTREAMSLAVQTGRSVLIWGPPGVGKTAWVHALARAVGRHIEVLIGSLRDPVDFGGLPVVQDGRFELVPMPWVRRIQSMAAAGRSSILFLDELTTAPPAVQAAMLRIVLDRVVGDEPLPEDLWILAAANPPEQAAGGVDLSPPLANRFAHFDFPFAVGEFVRAMRMGFPAPSVPILPGTWRQFIPRARAVVAAFLEVRPALVHRLPQDPAEAGRAWPSPRSWDMAADFLAAAMSVGRDRDMDLVAALVAGAVGPAPALEFAQWLREADLPSPEQLLADPEGHPLPERGDALMAAVAAAIAVAAASRESMRRHWDAAWTLLERVCRMGYADLAAAAMQPLADAWKAHPELVPVLRIPAGPLLDRMGHLWAVLERN